ncbi:VOC family protein [Lacrimispora indolis]|uniref:VOC family protein n=1 Tax=Lacrimispora indolis TaxID=69825 RepID=UPI00045E891A|nr:VOC family protein [Lacrimispora indolis]
MDIKLKTIILECRNIPQLLSFYTGLLHWPVVFEIDTFVGIHSMEEDIGIAFQYDKNYISPTWPSQPGQQQMMSHLDFAVTDKSELKEATEKAIELGARIANGQYGGEEWVTMLDPADHPFCFVVWNHE